jgi:transcriptional regulator with XRE-family HTH domain
MSIGLRIKELRLEKKMKSREFAMAINIDNSQYSKIENGKLDPTIEHLMEIYSKFNVSIDWLLMGEGVKYRDSKTAVQSNSETFFYKELKELNREIGALKNENENLKKQIADLDSARKNTKSTVNLEDNSKSKIV